MKFNLKIRNTPPTSGNTQIKLQIFHLPHKEAQVYWMTRKPDFIGSRNFHVLRWKTDNLYM